MCGYDLRTPQRRERRISITDILLVIGVFAVLIFWWQLGRNQNSNTEASATTAIMPTNVPLLQPTTAVTPTSAPVITTAPQQRQTQVVQRTHLVERGETLLSIADKYQVSVDDIKTLNGLANELIRAGDRLTIPVTVEVYATSVNASVGSSVFDYTVREGDTIFTIAARFGSTADDILAANGMASNDIIRPGQTIKIPIRQIPADVLDNMLKASTATTATEQGGAPSTVYAAPRLLSPPGDSLLPRAEAVLLRWVSVDLLTANEWYVIQIYPSGGSARQFPSWWLKGTSYRIDTDLAPAVGDSATYSWLVSVVRAKIGANGQQTLEAASPPSEIRKFTWQ